MFCAVVVAVPTDGLVFRQLHDGELLEILKDDEPVVMPSMMVAVWLFLFDTALMVTAAGETVNIWARAAPVEPRIANIAKAAMELNLKWFRKLLKLISTGDLPGR